MVTENEEESIPICTTSTDNTIQKKPKGFVTGCRRTQTDNASYLCIHDFVHKINSPDKYNIGGTYTNGVADFWFFFTLSAYNSQNVLLNLFVIHRKPGRFSINVSNSTECTQKDFKDEDPHDIFYVLPNIYEMYPFVTSKADQIHFLKAFSFERHLAIPPETTLLIPIKINDNPKYYLDSNFMKSVKLQHHICNLVTIHDQTDCVLKSATNKEFSVHKIVLAAHSPVLRDMIRNMKDSSLIFLDISDDDMELLLEFMYTGSFKKINHNCMKLLEIADKFQLRTLFLLIQYIVDAHITVDNAIEMAILAKNFKLQRMQNKVFDFILKNPDALKSEAFKNLNDVELAKYLIQFMQTQRD